MLIKQGGEKNAAALLPRLAPRIPTESPPGFSEEGMKVLSCSSCRCMATRMALPQPGGTLNLPDLSGQMFWCPALVFTFRCAPGGSTGKIISNSVRVRSSFIRPILFPSKLTVIRLLAILADVNTDIFPRGQKESQLHATLKSRVTITRLLRGKRQKAKS